MGEYPLGHFYTLCIVHPDELSFEMRLERHTTRDILSRRVIGLKTHNQTNYKCLPKFVQMDNASLV